MRKSFRVLIIILGLSTVVTIFAFKSDSYFEIAKNLDIFSSMYKEVNTYYVDDVEPSKFMRKGIDAMLASLDPYTDYISEDEIEGYRFQTTGKYGGIGASVRRSGDYVVIAEPYEGFAAYKAGLKAGDVIMEMDGKSIKGKTTDDVSKILKGQPGTEVKLTIQRYGETSTRVVPVKREEIQVKSVPYSGMLRNGIAYVVLTQFTEACSKDVEDALKELRAKNQIKGIILDLRGNPGGLLNEAVNVANIFVDKGQEIVSTKGKVEDWNKQYNSLNDPFDTSIPLVVLVNSGSASASEIVSGSIQDLDRGVIMGQKTFGKGLVQTTRALSYGTQLKVTTAHYYTPSGRCIQALDYAHRNEDGSVGKIPDSLKKAFKTKDGRTVYDGGGVDPDVKLDAQKSSTNIIASLVEKNVIFDYASEYALKHASISPATEFKLSDADYDDFVKFVASKNFDYTTKTEDALKTFEKAAEKEEYFDGLKADYDAIQSKMKTDKAQDLQKHKVDIMKILAQEIASRYYYQTGRVVVSLYSDDAVNKAVDLLGNTDEYNKLLRAN